MFFSLFGLPFVTGGISHGFATHGIAPGIGTHGIGLNTGLSGLGTHGISLNTGLSGLGTHGFHGIGTGTVFSGVGTHGIGGSHGVSHHHLLRESSPVAREVENEPEESLENSRNGYSKQSKDKSETKSTKSKLLEEVKEKLRAAEEKLQSSKTAILGKINRNIVKEKKVTESEDNNTSERDGKDETSQDSELGSTFNSPAIVQFPTGGRITYNMSPTLGSIPMMLGSSLLTRAPSGTSAINLNTPLGGSLTYDSPFFGYGQSNLGSAPYYSGQYRQVDISKCNCQPGYSTCSCPVSNFGSYSLINPTSGTSMSASPLVNQPYMSRNAPIVGASLIGKKVVLNTPLSESSLRTVQMPANLPCARNSGKDMLESSLNSNAQLSSQTIVAPIQSYEAPVGISLRAPILGSIQYQHPLNSQMYSSAPSPMVAFASLSEMKERDNQLKNNAEHETMNQDGPTSNTYYEQIYKANVEEKENCNPSSSRSDENAQAKTPSALKLAFQKKPEFRALEHLPSKILTTKTFKPTPILKLPMPKPIFRNANLRTTVKEPCT